MKTLLAVLFLLGSWGLCFYLCPTSEGALVWFIAFFGGLGTGAFGLSALDDMSR